MKLFFKILIPLLIVGVSACKDEYVNPFDQEEEEMEEEEVTEDLDPNSIAGIHANIFSKTCANSGCHDGTFEPDFRTIESSYNTLVNHPIIKNDPQNSYSLRVDPGNPDNSVLMARLNFDIDGNSGVMPLIIDPDSDWPEKKDEYIENIRTWIQNGAKDIFGNDPP